MKYTTGKYFSVKCTRIIKLRTYFYRRISLNLSCKMVKKSFCVSPKYQNMQSELETVLDALRNERNLTLVSSSNSKRADLIHEAFSFLREQEKDAITYYIDIASTQTLDELSKIFAEIVVGKDCVSLNQIFHYLSILEKRVYIAIENFQQILQYSEKGVDALLRSYVEESTNVTFIFAGNNEYKMHEMFVSPTKPFYQSTQVLKLL